VFDIFMVVALSIIVAILGMSVFLQFLNRIIDLVNRKKK